MGQFIAVLKDSFREAMDGFVIYLMLTFRSAHHPVHRQCLIHAGHG